MTEFEKEIDLIEKMGLKNSPLRLEYEKKCANWGTQLIGFKNAEGMIKVECKRCLAVYLDVSTDYLLMGRDYVNLHSRKRLEGVLQELSGIIADLQEA